MAEEKSPARLEPVVDGVNGGLARIQIEVDEHISAEDGVDAAEEARALLIQQTLLPEVAHVPDEVGYVPLAEVGAEFLFQVVAERAEKAAVILTTNLPFSEWTQMIPNARLCKALVDRITDRAHIVETGTESYRFRRTLENRKARNPKEP